MPPSPSTDAQSNAHASVCKLDHDGRCACIERPLRHAEGQRTALGHSVAGVGEQIEEHLPKLLASARSNGTSGVYSRTVVMR
jgi:hypothetical protein